MKNIRIGMAGLDTSHVPAFAKLLHEPSNEHHVPGASIVAAFPGGSPDFDLSINRVGQFTEDLRGIHNVEIVNAISDLRGKCDAIMLESIDGRVHLEQFREVSEWGLPVFIDKPLAISSQEARDIAKIALEKKVRVTSASAMRFSEKFQQVLRAEQGEAIIGADFHGPMSWVEKSPGYFWYGIHSAEMLFAAMGTGCREVLAIREESHDLIVGRWADGRIGTLRGNRAGQNSFGGLLHRKTGSTGFEVSPGQKPYYASLLERVVPFFRGESEMVPLLEAVEVIDFLDAANRSSAGSHWVALQG